MNCLQSNNFSMDSIDLAFIDGIEYVRQVKKRNQMKTPSSIMKKLRKSKLTQKND